MRGEKINNAVMSSIKGPFYLPKVPEIRLGGNMLYYLKCVKSAKIFSAVKMTLILIRD